MAGIREFAEAATVAIEGLAGRVEKLEGEAVKDQRREFLLLVKLGSVFVRKQLAIDMDEAVALWVAQNEGRVLGVATAINTPFYRVTPPGQQVVRGEHLRLGEKDAAAVK